MRNCYFGVYEKDLLFYLRSVLRPGDTVVDVGANIGYLSAFIRQLVGPAGAIYCFEPVPDYAALLEAAVSKVANIHVFRQAVGDREGRVAIKISGRENTGWNTIVPGLMKERTGIRNVEVPLTTLARHLEEWDVPSVRLIKIDVEGAEFLVLKGLAPWLEKGKRPHIITELCPGACVLLGSSTAAIFTLMGGYGYRPFVFSRKGLRRVYAGGVKLQPVRPQEITKTTDVVWEPH